MVFKFPPDCIVPVFESCLRANSCSSGFINLTLKDRFTIPPSENNSQVPVWTLKQVLLAVIISLLILAVTRSLLTVCCIGLKWWETHFSSHSVKKYLQGYCLTVLLLLKFSHIQLQPRKETLYEPLWKWTSSQPHLVSISYKVGTTIAHSLS